MFDELGGRVKSYRSYFVINVRMVYLVRFTEWL